MKRVCIAAASPDFAAGIVREKFLGQFHSFASLPAADGPLSGWYINHPEHLPPPAFRKPAASSRNAIPLGTLDFEIRIHEHPHPGIEADIWILQNQTPENLGVGHLGNCELAIHAGAGDGGVDLEQARAEGILVASVPDAASREAAVLVHDALTPHWEACTKKTLQKQIPVRMGLVGLGSLGQWISQRPGPERSERLSSSMQRAFFDARRWEFWGHDPFKPDHVFESCCVRHAPLQEIAGICDIVSVQVPLCADTRGLLGADYFPFQKPGQIIVNASPAEVVDSPSNPYAHIVQLHENIALLTEAEPARALALERALEMAALFFAGEVPGHLLMDPPIPRSVRGATSAAN